MPRPPVIANSGYTNLATDHGRKLGGTHGRLFFKRKVLDRKRRDLETKQAQFNKLHARSDSALKKEKTASAKALQASKDAVSKLEAELAETTETIAREKAEAEARKAEVEAREEKAEKRSKHKRFINETQRAAINTSEYKLKPYQIIEKWSRFWHQQRVEIYVVDRHGANGTWVHVTCEFTGKRRPDLLQTTHGIGGMPFTLDDKDGQVYCIKRPWLSTGLKKIEAELTFRVGVPGVFTFKVPQTRLETKRAMQGPLVFSHKGQYYYQTNDVYKRPPDD